MTPDLTNRIMIEIGKSKIVKVRVKRHGRLVPVLDEEGNPVTKIVSAEVVRRTRNALDGQYGKDRGRKLVVRLKAGDVIEIWPLGTRQRYSAELAHIFAWMIRGAAARACLEKARARKAKKQEARSRRNLRNAEKRLFTPAPNSGLL